LFPHLRCGIRPGTNNKFLTEQHIHIMWPGTSDKWSRYVKMDVGGRCGASHRRTCELRWMQAMQRAWHASIRSAMHIKRNHLHIIRIIGVFTHASAHKLRMKIFDFKSTSYSFSGVLFRTRSIYQNGCTAAQISTNHTSLLCWTDRWRGLQWLRVFSLVVKKRGVLVTSVLPTGKKTHRNY